MPTAALTPCAGRCGAVGRYPRGYCPTCTTAKDRTRRQARTMTYSEPWWRTYRQQFIAHLLEMSVVPACGATMPGGPTAQVSLCKQSGRISGSSDNGSSLHLHHEPELTEHERTDRAAVCDDFRIVLLCHRCHSILTQQRVTT